MYSDLTLTLLIMFYGRLTQVEDMSGGTQDVQQIVGLHGLQVALLTRYLKYGEIHALK